MKIEILARDVIGEKLQQEVFELFNQLNSDVRQRSLKEALEESNNIVFAICSNDQKTVGIASMVTYKVISGHKGMIEDVVVDIDQRGKGLGRKLMEKLLDEAKNMELDEILLFSGHHRKVAIGLYTSLGFKLKDSGLYRLVLAKN